MRDAVIQYCNGYVATPIIEACRRRGLFTLLDSRQFVPRAHLIESTGAQPRYLTVALDALTSFGWLECNVQGEYRLAAGSDVEFFGFDLTSLYAAAPSELAQYEMYTAQLVEAIDRTLGAHAQPGSRAVALAQGAVLVPLILACEGLNDANLQAKFASLNPRLAASIEKALLAQKWLARSRKCLSRRWRQLLQAGEFAAVSAHRSFLHRIDDVLFGDAPAALDETLLPADDRACLDDLHAKVMTVFDKPEVARQPRAIVDLGSADGCLWEKIYRGVKQHTARGRSLAACPLQVLSFDRRRRATGEAAPHRPRLDHQPFITDFEQPANVMRTLQGNGLDRKEDVLVLHALLKPVFPTDDSRTLAAQWRAHLQGWGDSLQHSTLVLAEAHDVAPLANGSTPAYLDVLRRLRAENSLSAETLLVLAASVGLFNEDAARRYPRVGHECRMSLHNLKRRDYVIRQACAADLPRLCELETLCWQHTRTPPQQIGARVAAYPEGQLVLEKDGTVLGAIYSQRIAIADALARHTATNVHELHDPLGAVVQLLAVNVDPQAQNLQLGDQLLEFMLQKCNLMTGVTRVVGVTLCKGYSASDSRSIDDYIRLRGGEQDPVLAFHEDHGAQIVRALAGYRPEDVANRGYGVLVSYDIQNRVPRRNTASAAPATSGAACAEIIEWLLAEVAKIFPQAAAGIDPARPLMELGLDSADLLKLQRRLEMKLGAPLAAAFFFEHSTIDKVATFLAASAPAAAPAQLQPQPGGDGSAGGPGDIAVIGMACALPGGIESPEELWRALVAGESMIEAYPATRGPWPTSLERPGIDQGGFMRDAESFDSAFFRIPPKEAQIVDPQQRKLLELAWACMEDAAILPATLKGTRTGVFIGASNTDYARRIQDAGLETEAHHATGNSLAVLANRLSYFFDLCGPSLVVDTACSASLVALHSALQSLRAGDCTTALVGGVNLICHPALSVAYHKAGMLAADGRCKVFDARANGYVRSEGAVVLLIKPLRAAVAAGDRIHAVIKGSAVNHGGLAAGLTVPNPQQQAQLLLAAWQDARIAPSALTYLEAHGTGTSLGDPIEMQGIETAFTRAQVGVTAGSCCVGSVKSNLGHLESAAGLAGLLKVILCLGHRQLPASIHFTQLNPKIRLEDSHLRICAALHPWESAGARVAGVSSFGSGGANAHVVVQEYPAPLPPLERAQSYLFVLSAADHTRLQEYARRVLRWLTAADRETEFPAAICTWQLGRTAMPQRLALEVAGGADLAARLEQWLTSEGSAGVTTSPRSPGEKPAAETVASALAARALARLGALWMAGADVDWRELYPRGPVPHGRISVPTYAFAKERYWIEAAPRAVPEAELAEPLFFAEEWREQACVAALLPPDEVDTVIFGDEDFHAQIARTDTAGLFARAVRVYPADQWRQVSERLFHCRVDQAADIQRVLEIAAAAAGGPIAVIHAASRGRAEAGIHALFDFFKAVSRSRQRIAHVTLVGEYDPARVDTCWDYSWIGFERSLRLALPQTRVSLLLTNRECGGAAALWDARHSTGVIWYQDHHRKILRCTEIGRAAAGDDVALKRHGGYLITGGCGALGYRFARDLARTCAPKLLLVGRSPLTPAIETQLDSLRAAGASEVLYQALDLGDSAAMHAWGERLPFALHGVIHAAGVHTVESFDQRSAADIHGVLLAKTLGTLALDEALATQPLDFVCYFSSSSAVLGDFGSCDYAIANRFQMAHARYRAGAQRPGRTQVINWPLWKEGAMAPGDAAQTAFYLQSSGQDVLETEAGLRIWRELLASGRAQTLVMVGKRARVQQSLDRLYSPVPMSAPPAVTQYAARGTETAATRPALRSVQENVLLDVRQHVSQCTGIAAQKLNDHTNLADYGLDSIHLTNLAQRFTQHFAVPITPVVFFSHATIAQLARHFIDEHGSKLENLYRSADDAANEVFQSQIVQRPTTVSPPAGPIAAEDVAVVGMSGRFPRAISADELWALLAEGRSAIGEIPTERWDWRDYFIAPGDPRNTITTNRGGFIDGVDEFDPLFFEVSPREAEEMDPAERLLLMESYKALEDAGLAPRSLAGTKVGVFVGMEEGQYDAITGRPGITTSGAAMVSSRLSYFLDLHGPAVATNTACSSGLVALHQAVKSLRAGECEAAIAAAISLSLSPAGFIMMSEAGMLSPDGQCASFAKKADGIGVGEAVVVLVLKPLAAALAAGDPIYGTIRASGINFDGKTNGVTAPSGRMQAELIESVYAASGIEAGDITHIVTHGTGTPLGDPVEISALANAFGRRGARLENAHCAITSCKSNLGHTLAAAGLVSVVGLLKGMQHRQIPPTLHCEVESEYFDWAHSPFYINRALRDWDVSNGTRMGAVSAFGRSGTNAHVVVAEHSSENVASAAAAGAVMPAREVLIPLSARTAEQLRHKAANLLAFIRAHSGRAAGEPLDLASLAYTLQTGRDALVERLGLIATSIEELANGLQSFLDDKQDGVHRGSAKENNVARLPREALDELQLATVLPLWVSGVEVDWRRLYTGPLPRRMRLPTYPFARERYWSQGVVTPAGALRQPARLHPLLHENTSDLEVLRYSASFSGEEFFLKDHRVRGQCVLPGVAYLEMARAAAMRALPQRSAAAVLELRDTVWMQPFSNTQTSLSIALFAAAASDAPAGDIGYEISSVARDAAGGQRETVHCQGRAVFSERPTVDKIDLAALEARLAPEPLDPMPIYSAYAALGLEYGPAFQAIRSVRRGRGELLARLSLPAAAAADMNEIGLPPSLLDGALQSALALQADLDQPAAGPPLPFELGTLRVLAPCHSEMRAWVRYSSAARPTRTATPLDIDLCDPDGQVCVEMRGFIARAPAIERTVAADSFVPVWNAVFPRAHEPAPVPGVLVLSRDRAQLEWVSREFPEAAAADFPVDAGIDVIRAELAQRPFGQLLWLAPDLLAAGDAARSTRDLIRAQEHGVLAVFRIAKALLAAGYAGKELAWTLITRRTQGVRNKDRVEPAHAGIAGLIGSLAKEYPHWKLKVIDADDVERLSLRGCLALESDAQGNGYAFRDGEWFRQELAQVTVPGAPPVYKHNGVYVVIGGAGGLGEVWSRHLIEHYQANIVWIGRRTIDAALEAKLAALAALGPAPLYISADATNEVSLAQAKAAILGKFRRIDGVIHSALVLRDQTMMAMDEARFRAVLSSKVDISVNIERVFGELDLDFMLFFSSLMSFLKAPGQSNYAAGCTFKDSFARSLQPGRIYPVKTMNFGYWGGVGVVSDEFYRKRMEQIGIGSIDSRDGLSAVEMLLGADLNQLVFFKALDRKIIDELRVTETLVHPPRPVTTNLEHVQARLAQLDADEPGTLPADGQLPEEANALAAQILAASLMSLGLAGDAASRFENPAGGRNMNYQRWLASSLRHLQQESWLASDGTPARDLPPLPTLWRTWNDRRTHWNPNLRAQLDLLETCLRALPAILRGETRATDVLFPESSLRLVEGVYRGNRTADYYNDILGRTLRAYLESPARNGAALRILEIGAGTGGTTARILPMLQEFAGAIDEYRYTDLSKAFLMHAEQHYQPQLAALTTAIFDVSAPLVSQPVTPGGYDVVIATNVLHATPDIRRALRNAKALLRPQAVLLLNELSAWTLFTHLTFGLLEGWWLHRDSGLRLPDSPALSPERWSELLGEEGFSSILYPAARAHAFGQQVIAALSDGVVRQPLPAPEPAREPAMVRVETQAASPAVAAGSADSLRAVAIEYFRRLVAATLKMKTEQLDPAEALEKYGLDSILVVQLANQVRKVLPDITSTLFFEVQSVQGLVDHLLETRREALQALVSASGASPLPLPAPDPVHSPARSRRAPPPRSASAPRAIFDVAIVGCSGRYPQSPDLEAFWKNLAGGINCIAEIPRERWDWREHFDAEKGKAGKTYTRWGGFLDNIDAFDPLFFKISPREAKSMDPQERLFLQTCYHAIEDAGYTPDTLGDVEKIGVFVGVMNSRYNSQPLYYSVANRVSYLFNFQGPSLAVDTACSSSLTAIHLALESLYSGLSECAIAGGVNLIIDPVHYQELSALTMLSAGSECRSFGAGADGFVDAEGVGAVILKPLQNAERDGDQIYGVIKGSAVNAGGKTNGYTVPNPRAQAQVVAKALERAGVAAADVSYLEAHGTGTTLGDPIEIAGLTRAFHATTQERGFCALGSLKSNIGHCESAAGIAGLTKVLLQLKHGRLVPSLHAQATNPEINFSQTPFRLQQTLAEWARPRRTLDGVVREIPRTAGISSFGAGGANAHLIVQEYRAARATVARADEPVIVPLSARTAEQLRHKARDLLGFIRRRAATPLDLPAVAHTLQVGREPLEERAGFLVRSAAELERRLEGFLAGEQGIDGLYVGQVKRNKDTLAWFTADADLRDTVEKWLRERKLPQLVDLWVKGLQVDWNRLYTRAKPARLSLPAYPFAQERYWRERAEATPGAAAAAATGPGRTALHPLVHENLSTIHQQCYRSSFAGNETLLAGQRPGTHTSGATAMMPAAVFLEMARAAVAMATDLARPSSPGARVATELYNIAWADPVPLAGQIEMRVALFARGNDELGYEIYSPAPESGADLVHCQGRAFLRQSAAPRHIDIAQLKSRMRVVAAQSQAISALHLGERQMLAEIQLPVGAQRDPAMASPDLALHPIVLDSALAAAASLLSSANHASLPLAVESVRILAPCAAHMFAWARDNSGGDFPHGNLQLDVDWCDPLGNVCIEMRGVTYERVTEPVVTAGVGTPRPAPELLRPVAASAARESRSVSPGKRGVALAAAAAPAPAPRAAAKPSAITLT